MNTSGRTLKKLSWAIAASSLMFGGSVFAQQASISLTSSAVHYCNTVDNQWTIDKTVSPTSSADAPLLSPAAVEWTVTATKNAATEGNPPPAQFCVEGAMTITNGGAGPASVGNIVVSVQRMQIPTGDNKKRWVSIASDISDAKNRNAATYAHVVASTTSENATWNQALNGGHNYTASGQVGTFTKTGTGTISLSNGDADVFAVDYTIPGGGSVTFDFVATFDSAALGINPTGDHLRTEILVTFGNAGARGGSGASIGVATGLTGVDIDGDALIDCNNSSVTFQPDNDECNVRTVPMRFSLDVPPLEYCNDNITIADLLNGGLLSHDVSVNVTDQSDGITGTCSGTTACNLSIGPTSASGSWSISAGLELANGALTGSIANVSTFTGHHVDATGATPTDDCCTTQTGTASTVTYLKAPDDCGPNGCVQSCPDGLPPNPDGSCDRDQGGTFCTFTKGKINASASNAVAAALSAQWSTLFPSGLTVGVGSATDNAPTWAAYFDNTADGVANLRLAMTLNGGSNQGESFGADQGLNPSSYGHAANLAEQLVALVVSTTMGDAGVLAQVGVYGPGSIGVGALNVCLVGTYTGTCTVSVPITGVGGLISIANRILSGDTTTGYSAGTIQGVLNSINNAFDDCVVTDSNFVQQYLSAGN